MSIKETIIDLSRRPHNFGELKDTTKIIEEGNQSCGDMLKLYLKIEDDVVTDVTFKGLGCALSIAAASLVTDYIKGKSIVDIKTISKETVLALLDTEISSGRMRCALLPLEALKKL